jgi:hypothetical protein
VRLNTHLHTVFKLRMGGATSPIPIHAFALCIRAALYLLLTPKNAFK